MQICATCGETIKSFSPSSKWYETEVLMLFVPFLQTINNSWNKRQITKFFKTNKCQDFDQILHAKRSFLCAEGTTQLSRKWIWNFRFFPQKSECKNPKYFQFVWLKLLCSSFSSVLICLPAISLSKKLACILGQLLFQWKNSH